MKRALEGEEEVDEIPWNSLITDTICYIATFLDPLSKILFSLVNKENYKHLHQPSGIPLILMEQSLFLYGSLRLIERYDWKQYEANGRKGISLSGYAAQRGELDILQWIDQKGYALYAYTTEQAARYGHMHVIQWLKSIDKLVWSKKVLQQACMFGSVENLQWLVDHGCPDYHIHVHVAIRYGLLNVIHWLDKRGHIDWSDPRMRSECIELARQEGQTEIKNYFEKKAQPQERRRRITVWFGEIDNDIVALPDPNLDDL